MEHEELSEKVTVPSAILSCVLLEGNEWPRERGRKGKIIFIAFILFALLRNNKQKCFMDALWTVGDALRNRW